MSGAVYCEMLLKPARDLCSNVLDESSHSLQGTETLKLQGPLTTLNEDFTPVPATISPTLPRELLERIFLLLDTKSMLTCRLVNREFNEILQSSMMLYFLACKAAGVIDNPQSPISYAERLDALLKREDAWRKLKPVFEMKIKLDYHSSESLGSMYSVVGGIYFLIDRDKKVLHYCHLPSSPKDTPQWIRIPVHDPGMIVDCNIFLCEHDLLVNLISSGIGNQANMESLDLVFLQLSTGEFHPLARHPRIHVQRSPLGPNRPSIVSTIAGDNLALVVHSQDSGSPDKLIVFNWKTGHKRLEHETTENGYCNSRLVFVSPELLLVPNLILSHFEVWQLPPCHPDHELPVQILTLKIPAVSPDYSIITFRCYGDLGPILHSMPYFSPRPFHSSPENYIIIAKLRMLSHSPLPRRRHVSFTLIMDRRALLDTIQKLTSPSLLEQQDLPTWLTNEITVHRIADPDGASVKLGAQSKLVSMMLDPRTSPRSRASRPFATSQTSPTLHMSASFSSSAPSGSSTISSTSRYNFLQVKWADWGSPISRWFELSESHALCITNCTGQRYAFTVPSSRNRRRSKIVVTDFNPHNVRRNTEIMARVRGEGDDNGARGNSEEGKEEEEEELEMLDHGGVFSEEVYMGFKCVVYYTLDDYNFKDVLMDEDRLLGLEFDSRGIVRKGKVLYFG